jgi:outer membrane protein assembly factor BamB
MPSNPRGRFLIAALALASLDAVAPTARAQHGAGPLVSYDSAARVGLERAWFAQVPLDPSRSRVTAWQLHQNRLYCVTDAGIVTAIDAETGASLWSRQVGRPGVPAFGPDANDKYLGVVTSAQLYMLDRETGRLKWRRVLGSAPSSGPAMTKNYAYVALVTGRIEGYRLDDPATQPWYYQSKGRTYLRPTTTGSVVSWPTTEGYLYVSGANDPGVRFRLKTSADIVTSPAEMEPYLYIASLDGYLYCLDERNGSEMWRYSTGYPIESSPALVGEQAYVASMEPVLHCLNAKSGASLWVAPGVSHFAAQGKDRVYVSDQYGNLLVLDAKTGVLLGDLPTAEGLSTLVNDQSDRIFLVSNRGLVQCLREIGATEPTMYRHAAPKPAAGEKPAAEGEASPFETDGAPPEESPFEAEGAAPGGEPAEAAPAEPAGPAAEQPAAGLGEDENPFGGF